MRADSALGELVQEQMLGHFAHAWPAMLQAITATLQPGEVPIRVKFTPDGTRALISNAMRADFGFEISAQEYAKLYICML